MEVRRKLIVYTTVVLQLSGLCSIEEMLLENACVVLNTSDVEVRQVR